MERRRRRVSVVKDSLGIDEMSESSLESTRHDEIELRYSHVSDPLYIVFHVPHLHAMISSGDHISDTTPTRSRIQSR